MDSSIISGMLVVMEIDERRSFERNLYRFICDKMLNVNIEQTQ